MKKIFLISIIAASIVSLSGCANNVPPDGLNEAQAVTVIRYNNNDFFGETSSAAITTTSPITSNNSITSSSIAEKELSVPENYKKINSDIYAVIEAGEVAGYVKGSYNAKSQKWTWEKCDSEGKIITTTQETTTTAKSTTKKSTTKKSTTKKTTTKKVQKTQPQTKQPTQTQRAVTQPPSTQPPKTQTIKQTSKTTTRKTVKQKTTTTTNTYEFKWETISQGQCPIDVSNYFDNFIILKNSVFQQTSSDGCTYALLKAKNDKAIRINSVSSDGKIKYSIVSSGPNYVIIKINKDIKVTYYQQ